MTSPHRHLIGSLDFLIITIAHRDYTTKRMGCQSSGTTPSIEKVYFNLIGNAAMLSWGRMGFIYLLPYSCPAHIVFSVLVFVFVFLSSFSFQAIRCVLESNCDLEFYRTWEMRGIYKPSSSSTHPFPSSSTFFALS